MSRPKSGAAARPASQAGNAAVPDGPRERIDNKKNGVPQDALRQAVFDKPKVAKKVFQSMDRDKDKKLSRAEFARGMAEMLQDENISESAIDALWKQTDINLDGFISWEEFRLRFCVDDTRNFYLRQELSPLLESEKIVLKAIRPYIRQLYDSSDSGRDKRKAHETWLRSGFDDGTKFTMKVLNSICELFSELERKQAQGPVPAWIKVFEEMSKQDLQELFMEIELKNNGTVNLVRYDKRLGRITELPLKGKLNYKRRLGEVKGKGGKAEKPSTADARNKTPAGANRKNGKGQKDKQKPVVLKSIPPNAVNEWLAHEIFTHVAEKRPDLPTRVAPSLKNWNVTEREKWGLENSDGRRCYIFLADSFEVKNMIRGDDKDVIVFCTYRLELNGLHTFEWLYHAKIYLDKHEAVTSIDSRPIQLYKSGVDYPLPRNSKLDFRDWMTHVHVPDIFVASVPPREY